jgi:hypothetical protein
MSGYYWRNLLIFGVSRRKQGSILGGFSPGALKYANLPLRLLSKIFNIAARFLVRN